MEFYRNYQDDITPAGLSFFQSDWDSSLTDFYHNILNMKEPIYEYDFPEPYISDEKWFPLKQPFNLYLDKHRDQKEVCTYKITIIRKFDFFNIFFIRSTKTIWKRNWQKLIHLKDQNHHYDSLMHILLEMYHHG